MNLFKGRKGFTLIELLIVITIIGVLAVALVPRIVGAPAKARDAARKADLQQIATGIELYVDAESGDYPKEGSSGAYCVSGTSGIEGDLTAGYLTAVPQDPQDKDSGVCSSGYGYYQLDDGYLLYAALESASSDSSTYNNPTTTGLTTSDSSATIVSSFTTCESTACAAGAAWYIIAR